MSTQPAIEVEKLVRDFQKGPRAVDGIDLAVSPGEIYGFLGPNGAGKSTTVLMLTTLLPPTSGRASVGGYDIVRQGAQVRATIGAALQEAALDAILTGREHLMLQGTLQGLPAAQRRQRTHALLQRVGLTEAADRRVGGYSGGMKRRLDLALALVHSPRILFLDEPTTGLDPQSRAALWEEVARLAHDEGMTVFLTTQYLEEADVLADRIGIIDHGRIVAEGTPAQLKAEIGSPTVEVTPTEPESGDRLAELLSDFGEMRAQRPRQRHRAAARRRSRAGRDRPHPRPGQPARGDAAAAPALARRRVPRQDRAQAGGIRRRAGRRDATGGRRSRAEATWPLTQQPAPRHPRSRRAQACWSRRSPWRGARWSAPPASAPC